MQAFQKIHLMWASQGWLEFLFDIEVNPVEMIARMGLSV
jgi:hypothetical protein